MKIIAAIKSGLYRSIRVWKGILVFWIISLVMVSFIVVPMKASLNSVLGNSMITEKLAKGINIDVLGDLGSNLHAMGSSLLSGVLMLILAAIITNAFITGGLFDSVRNNSGKFTAANFFRASAKNFWPYLIISVILFLVAVSLFFFLVVIPVSFAAKSESSPEGTAFLVFDISFFVFLAAMSVIYLVADYSRAWQACRGKNAVFSALGFGISRTFGTFIPSFSLVAIMLIIQVLPAWCVIKIISRFIPSKEGGIVLLFILSQAMFILKIFLRTLRYGSITSLMELTAAETEGREAEASSSALQL